MKEICTAELTQAIAIDQDIVQSKHIFIDALELSDGHVATDYRQLSLSDLVGDGR